jgi:uncharacterized RmlC-like cupin family protein
MSSNNWRNGVQVTRGRELAAPLAQAGRVTAMEFAGTGGSKTWIGLVRMAPLATTGGHAHGRHEAALHVLAGRGRIRWGERLEYAADVGPGDFVLFTPHVPHQEENLDADAPLDLLVVRSDGERIVEPRAAEVAEAPEFVK